MHDGFMRRRSMCLRCALRWKLVRRNPVATLLRRKLRGHLHRRSQLRWLWTRLRSRAGMRVGRGHDRMRERSGKRLRPVSLHRIQLAMPRRADLPNRGAVQQPLHAGRRGRLSRHERGCAHRRVPRLLRVLGTPFSGPRRLSSVRLRRPSPWRRRPETPNRYRSSLGPLADHFRRRPRSEH